MAFKAFFDGANQADSRRFTVITLAAFSGSAIQWNNFVTLWTRVLAMHGAKFLHTTDAVSLQAAFKKWSGSAVEAFLEDCVSVIESCVATRCGNDLSLFGLRLITVSVILADFSKALKKFPNIGCVEQLCAIYAAAHCTAWARSREHHKLQFYFDQGEPFYGHIRDRIDNKKASRAAPDIREISAAEMDMREAPGLQAADILAWAVNHEHQEGKTRYGWQKRLLAIDRDADLFDYSRLSKPNLQHVETVNSWKLPPRRKRL